MFAQNVTSNQAIGLTPSTPNLTPGQQAEEDLYFLSQLLTSLVIEMESSDSPAVKLQKIQDIQAKLGGYATDLKSLENDFPQYPFLAGMIGGALSEIANITEVPAQYFVDHDQDQTLLNQINFDAGQLWEAYNVFRVLFPFNSQLS